MMDSLCKTVLAFLGVGAIPTLQPDITHDDKVHNIRNKAHVTLGRFDMEMRRARKAIEAGAATGDIERQIEQAREATEALKVFADTHRGQDDDDGLLKGMDGK